MLTVDLKGEQDGVLRLMTSEGWHRKLATSAKCPPSDQRSAIFNSALAKHPWKQEHSLDLVELSEYWNAHIPSAVFANHGAGFFGSTTTESRKELCDGACLPAGQNLSASISSPRYIAFKKLPARSHHGLKICTWESRSIPLQWLV